MKKCNLTRTLPRSLRILAVHVECCIEMMCEWSREEHVYAWREERYEQSERRTVNTFTNSIDVIKIFSVKFFKKKLVNDEEE